MTGSSTQRPISRIRSDASATGMNSPGQTMPLVGCIQRTSDSTPVIRPVATSKIGW